MDWFPFWRRKQAGPRFLEGALILLEGLNPGQLIPKSTVLLSLSIQREGNQLIMEWDQEVALHSAASLDGSWEIVPGASSPFHVVTEEKARFFRVVSEQ